MIIILKMKDFISNRDDFGHNVGINFRGNGGTHQTVIGGLISMVVLAFMALYSVYMTQQMFTYQRDSINQVVLHETGNSSSELSFE